MTIQRQLLTVTATDASTPAAPEVQISTGTLDRMQDRVLPDGGEMGNFFKNPTLNYGHMRDEAALLPVGTVTAPWRAGAGWRMRWRWLAGDAFADRVKNAWEQGVLRASSIEFVPLDSVANRDGGVDYRRWELTGVALCATPANPEAVRACKALGLPVDVRPERVPRPTIPDDAIVFELIESDPRHFRYDRGLTSSLSSSSNRSSTRSFIWFSSLPLLLLMGCCSVSTALG
jgi:hypothetical protein